MNSTASVLIPLSRIVVAGEKQKRERLSIWKFRDSGEDLETLYRQVRKEEPQKPIGKVGIEAKKGEGTVIVTRQVTIGTALTPFRQSTFEEKHVYTSDDCIPRDYLTSLGIAVTCKKGLKPESPNQDDYTIYIDGNELILCVFDGHGPYGHEVAGFIHTLLPSLVTQEESFPLDPLEAFSSAFQKCESALEQHCEESDSRFNCIVSGSTASIVLVRGENLYCANVGDSRAVMSRMLPDGSREATDLTIDHQPTIPEEKRRIELKRGEVKQLPGDITHRVFVKGKDFPGLAMTRAFGDLLAQEIGVINSPETRVFPIQSGAEFLLLCSDGVWEFISSKEAVDLVGSFGRENLNSAVEKLAETAWERWEESCPETVDDITVMVAYFPQPRRDNNSTMDSSMLSKAGQP